MSRILLLLHHKQNRRLLAEWLAHQYEVLLGEPFISHPFDLCILDAPALDRLQSSIQARKVAEQPVFLPFLLVTSKRQVGMVTHHLWESVDESIASPIEKAELQARLEILLRARRLSIENVKLLRQLEAELHRAAQVQAELLPRQLPALADFDIAARCIPAQEVGGDFYDWQQTASETLTLTLGDAMGKGMSAALLMTTVRAALRSVAPTHTPGPAMELVRRALQDDLVRSGSFVTLFHAQLDWPAHRLSYVDAGHGYVFVRRADGGVETLRRGGPPLGIPVHGAYQEGQLLLHRGDALVLYSDALWECQPELSLDRAALAHCLAGATDAQEMLERLVTLAKIPGPLTDDLTVLVLLCVKGK